MPPSPHAPLSRIPPSVVIGTALHGVFVLALLVYLAWYVPRLNRHMRDFNLQLPDTTQWTLALSSYFAAYVFLLPVLFLVLLGLDMGAALWLRRATGRAWPAQVWSGLVSVVILVLLGFVLLTSLGPLVKLREGLSQ